MPRLSQTYISMWKSTHALSKIYIWDHWKTQIWNNLKKINCLLSTTSSCRHINLSVRSGGHKIIFSATANCKCGGWREVSKVTSGKYGICQQQHGTCWINCSKSETPLHSIQIWIIFTKNSTFNFTFSRFRLYFVI